MVTLGIRIAVYIGRVVKADFFTLVENEIDLFILIKIIE